MSQKRSEFFIVTGLFFLLAAVISLPIPSAMASPSKVGEQIPVIMVGDRLVDTSYSLGVVPAAMSVHCSMWPMCDIKSSVQVLGCPGCLLKRKLGDLELLSKICDAALRLPITTRPAP